MSRHLVKHWRRVARNHEQAAAGSALGREGASERIIGETLGFARALRWCADSLERSMKLAAQKRAGEPERKGGV